MSAGPDGEADLREAFFAAAFLDPDLNIATVSPESPIAVAVATRDESLWDAGAPPPIDRLSVALDGREIDGRKRLDLKHRRARLIPIEAPARKRGRSCDLRSPGYRGMRRTGRHSCCVPWDAPVTPEGGLAFVRKQCLPFRHCREASRERHRAGSPRGLAGPVPRGTGGCGAA